MVRAVKTLMRFVEGLLIVLLFASVSIVVLQIIWRYLLRNPLSWTDQMARFLFIWMTMLGIPVLFNRNILMSFDLVQNKFNDRNHDILRIVFRILGLFFCVSYFFFSLQLCMRSIGNFFAGIRIPYNALYAAQPTVVCCWPSYRVPRSLKLWESTGKGG
jgi:TRAP-type C4-dicarboxylate transport system permease small subunit